MQVQFSVDTWPRKHMTAAKFKQLYVSSINFFTQIQQNKTNMHLKIYYSVFETLQAEKKTIKYLHRSVFFVRCLEELAQRKHMSS